jgi:phenylacetate-CoA ligase
MDATRIHDPSREQLSRDELQQLQIERLQTTLNRVYRNVAFYRSAFDAHAVNLERITNVDALAELPLTTTEDLQRSYPYDMFAVPLKDIVRIHSSAGAGATPIVVGYTRNDLNHWTECVARLLVAAGINEHDVVQIALDYHLFPGGFGFHQGAERIGASVIPASLTAAVEKQVAVIRDFKTTALVTTPSHAARIAAALGDLGVGADQLRLRLGLFGAERWSERLRDQLQQQLHIQAIDTYGLTAIMGPGVAGECRLRHGLHINEDHYIAEVVDPATRRPVEPGSEGELVLTTISQEGFPLIRYRTGDITSLDRSRCACGRTFARMARVAKRTDDLIQIHGVGFVPAQIEQILADVDGASPHYQIVLDRDGGDDTLEVRVEVSEKTPLLDEVRTLEHLRQQVAARIRTTLDLDARVTLAEPRSLRRVDEQKQIVIDRRQA